MNKVAEGQYAPSVKFTNAHGVSRYFGAGNKKIRYVDFSEDADWSRLVVLIHGGHGDWRHYLANIQGLLGDARVIAVDIPGFGLSAPPAEISLLALSDPIARLVSEISAGDVTIVGFSFGSLVAAEVCRLVPGAISRICTVSPAGFGGHTETMAGRRQESADLARLGGLEAGVRNTLRRIMLSDVHASDEEALVALMAEMVRASQIVVRPVARRVSIVDKLAATGKPVLVLLGDQDPYHVGVLDQRRDLLLRSVPVCDVRIVPRAAHWVMWEHPDVFTRAVLDFAETTVPMS